MWVLWSSELLQNKVDLVIWCHGQSPVSERVVSKVPATRGTMVQQRQRHVKLYLSLCRLWR
jgi:hypothetical protein